ncbi:Ethylene receptor 2 [Actinoplanes sp. SE50]|uniref:HAMP domain-containing sensor histidine kinase n=1 Tax=unclassified Actinoplanes TaxID=2626549 RepID=UPI00023EC768|nr:MULTISPECIES: HAMP domain-containing sensor histidine kinase [unclassified Actinoplanes]AEV83103.1 Ethylene receptor 2 [Actinoplanes sp. SE50/110]ATO81499.1 Ethylene receptor 2 [Actinoplanes sp. SE50]SLL98906.1 two-component system sensor kinase [Actinoplanes sp. SE50/110]
MTGLRSVRARSALAAAAAAAVILTGGGLWARHFVGQQQLEAGRRSAVQQVNAMGLAATTIGTGGAEELRPAFYPDVTFEVVDTTGAVLSASPDLAPYESDGRAVMPAADPLPGDISMDTPEVSATVRLADPPGDHALDGRTVTGVRIQGAPVSMTDHPELGPTFAVYVFVTPLAAERAVATVDRILVGAVPLAVLVVALVAWFATRRALRPVEAIRARTAEVTASRLADRVEVPATGDEIAALATTINAMLDRLQRADRAQRRMVSDAAHELRSPLAILRAGLEVAQAYPDRTDWPATAATAVAQAQRLTGLADDLLLLARLDAGTAPPQPEVDADVVAVLSRMAVETITRDGVTVTGPAGPPVPVRLARVPFERIVRNLLDNAVRHAGRRVEIRITADPAAAGRTRLRVEVADDGPGIHPGDRDRIFDRFTRVDAARDRHAGGAGLGLSLARELATQLGGILRVADRPVPGATFELTLTVTAA